MRNTVPDNAASTSLLGKDTWKFRDSLAWQHLKIPKPWSGFRVAIRYVVGAHLFVEEKQLQLVDGIPRSR